MCQHVHVIFIGSKLDILVENHKIVYKETRCQPVQDQWPPNQPYTIVNVALIHHEGEQTQQELIDMSMRNVSTVERLSSHHPRVTKRITDIFRSTQKRILIEGAPGIGKTVLAKQIAYCWANGEILTDMKLFLLVIRDPNLHCVSSITELVHYLNDDYIDDIDLKVAVEELRKSKGSGIVLVIDGYDECPSDSKLKCFIDKLVEGKRLPMCMVVITSRPTASLLLRQLVNQRIEILGLAKKEQDQYISESLKQSSEKIIRLQEYLKQQPTINSLTYVPLHLSVLLYLFNQDSLPETLTEMNEYFIIHTIYRHLTKGRQFSYIQIDKITDLPEPELTIVYQLSKLAYNGLCNSKLVFTYDEMKGVCPKIDETPGAINGFGLMQTVECYHHKGAATGKAISLNFLHFTMQEYLAALHVSTLPSEEQSSLIEIKFWEGKFNFMWVMYVGIVGPQSTGFERVINIRCSHASHDTEYNIRARENLFLFQCYLEGKDANLMPEAITSIFSDGNINLSKVTLLPHHIMSLTVFMMRSTTQWKSLNLNGCSIGSNGMSILAKFFVDFKERVVTIKYINLRNNRLTSLWGTHLDQDHTDVNSGILQSVEDLDLSLNSLEISSSISECLNSTLCKLNLSSNNITDEGAKRLAEAIKVNRKLQKLNTSSNKITDEGAKRLAEAIQVSTTLQELNISSNKITDEGAKRLAEAIGVNRTLQELNISKNCISKEGVMKIVEACTINRTLHKLVCTHNNLSKSGLAAINEYIRKENAVQIFEASWNSLCSKNNQLAFKTTFELLDVQQKLQSDYDNIKEELWYVDEITDPKYVRKFLQCSLDMQHVNVTGAVTTDDQMLIFCDCLMNNSTLTELNLSSNKITDEGVRRLVKVIQVNTTLRSLDISHNTTSDDGMSSISDCLKINATLSKLNLSNNKITDEVVKMFSEAIQINTTLQDINMSSNNITDEGAKRLAEAIKVNTTLKELNISKNWISKEGVMRIVEACTINRTLHKLVCTHNNLSKSGLAAINEYIRKENAVQIFEASWNSLCSKNNQLAFKTTFELLDVQQKLQSDYDNIKEELWYVDEITDPKYVRKFLQCSLDMQHVNVTGTVTTDDQMLIFCDCLMNNSTLTELNLSSNKITDEGVRRLVKAIQVNTTLRSLDISHNTTSDDGMSSISDCLKINATLSKLNLSNNKITDEVVKMFSEAIQINTTLQDINMSSNNITDEGAKRLAEAIKVNTTLKELNISKNWISKEGVMRIVEACTINRTLHKLVCTHNNLSKSGLATINEYIRKENAVQIFEASYNTVIVSSRCGSQLVIPTFRSLRRSPDGWENNLLDYDKQVWLVYNTIWENLPCRFTHDSLTELKLSCYIIPNNALVDMILGVMQVITLQKLNVSISDDDGAIAFSECLKTNTTLIELDVSWNNITCKGASVIAEAIQVNTALQKLNISSNEISDDGAIAFSKCLKTNTTLIELNMSRNNITCKGASVIAEAIQVNTALQKLNISSNEISDDGAIAFSECLKTNTTLIELDVSWNNITCKGASVIAEAIQVNTALQKLNISSNEISDDGAIAFSECLKTNTTLIELDMSRNNITCKGASVIAEAIQVNTALQKLNISSNEISDDGAIAFSECLKTNTTLIELDMSRNNITCKGASVIAEAIQVNTALQKLNISSNEISDDGAIAFSECLKTNTTLIELDMSWNNITCKGASVIAEAIQVNTALQKLNISSNEISDDGAIAFSECLKTNTTLIELDMSWNNITCKGASVIAEAIQVNTALQKLNISSNEISDDGAIAFSECLKTNTTLIELDMSWNNITCKGASVIAEAIQVNTALQKLNITSNRISDDGAIAFSECLKTNTTLIELNMSWNNITCKGASVIAEAIQVNTALQKLNITSNRISDDGAIAFSKCLKTNTTLIELDMSGNNITSKGGGVIAEATSKHCTTKTE